MNLAIEGKAMTPLAFIKSKILSSTTFYIKNLSSIISRLYHSIKFITLMNY